MYRITTALNKNSILNSTGLRILATPWSPPAWMKVPVNGAQSMLGSATPNGLIATEQNMLTWANYISKFITAYKVSTILKFLAIFFVLFFKYFLIYF